MMVQRHDLLLTLVMICGVYNTGFAVFHILFWRVFGWPATIRSTGHVNSAITQTLNLMLIYCFSFYGGWLIWVGANGIRPIPCCWPPEEVSGSSKQRFNRCCFGCAATCLGC